jgi:hypothetical protein
VELMPSYVTTLASGECAVPMEAIACRFITTLYVISYIYLPFDVDILNELQ